MVSKLTSLGSFRRDTPGCNQQVLGVVCYWIGDETNLHSCKLNIAMEHESFKDAFPIETQDFPVYFGGFFHKPMKFFDQVLGLELIMVFFGGSTGLGRRI